MIKEKRKLTVQYQDMVDSLYCSDCNTEFFVTYVDNPDDVDTCNYCPICGSKNGEKKNET